MPPVPIPPLERFWKNVEITDSCWIWNGLKDVDGYGRFYINSKTGVRAHRFCYELYNEKIGDGMCVCHSCDMPSCVNPDHLWIGTNIDNINDRTKKGRSASGEDNGNSKLTKEEVLTIRNKYFTGKFSSRKLSKECSVSQPMICAIINNKNWKI